MHILFLTSNNLATNPRLYKELKLAILEGHQTSLIQYKLGNWSDAKSDELIKSEKLNTVREIQIDATPDSYKLSWLKWGLLEKLAQKVYPLLKNNIKLNALASSRRSIQIIHSAKKLKHKPDLICAHNLATLYPAYKLSQKWNIPFIFDVEDYHPGEFIRYDAVNEKKRREFLMQQLLPKATALSSASPLMGEYSLKLIGGHPNHQVVLNSFPASEFSHQSSVISDQFSEKKVKKDHSRLTTHNSQLKLVWFSQKISFGRGLEQLFEALTTLHPSGGDGGGLIITLIGDMDPEFNEQIIQPFLKNYQTNDLPTYPPNDLPSYQTKHLSLIEPLSQPDLHAELANHDIGLALEPGKDLNNELAISNKIIAYTQAGLYILATDTLAQKQFMEEHNACGTICKQNAAGIKDGLMEIYEGIEELRKSRIMRFEKGKELAWEKERDKLIEMWRKLGKEVIRSIDIKTLRTLRLKKGTAKTPRIR